MLGAPSCSDLTCPASPIAQWGDPWEYAGRQGLGGVVLIHSTADASPALTMVQKTADYEENFCAEAA